MELEQCKAKI